MAERLDGIRRLTAHLWIGQSRFFYTNTGIFASDGHACLVDPNMAPEELARIRRFLRGRGLHASWIVLTHYHWDHILGPEAFPEARVIGHELLPQQLTGKSGADTLTAIAQWEAENQIPRLHPFSFPKLNRVVDPPDQLVVGTLRLDLIATPGHSPDQLAIYEGSTATLWASDILSDVEIPFISDSLSSFERTLARLAELEIQMLVPGHGFPSGDVSVIRSRIAEDRAYLAELRARVEASVAAGVGMAETVERCAEMQFRNRDENAIPHRRNVESVYAELGGDVEPGGVGWSREVRIVDCPGSYRRRQMMSQYAAAGVDIDAATRAVDLMKSAIRRTYTPSVLADVGSFGGLFALDNLPDQPVLVASTDGVGTKVKLAAQLGRWRGIGHDIVNHCVNDILVQGARPLFFLDYIATSKLIPEAVAEVVTGIAEACEAVGCALLGGETAEMPGVYAEGAFDVAGTVVGLVSRAAILPRPDQMAAGDVILGLPSSGPHTNGYSLIRRVVADQDLNQLIDGVPLADALLAAHRCYLPQVQQLLDAGVPVRAMAHITGGGFVDNIPRVLPNGLAARIERERWQTPVLFEKLVDLEWHVGRRGVPRL